MNYAMLLARPRPYQTPAVPPVPRYWDITTARFVQSKKVSTEDTNPTGLFFKTDGTKMYVSGDAGSDVNEYELGSAWDISSSVFLQRFFVGVGILKDVFFTDDGLRMYCILSDDVDEYALGTAWDVSTAVFVRHFEANPTAPSSQGVFFKPDGMKMFLVSSTTDSVHEYQLSEAWNVSTASETAAFSVAAQSPTPFSVSFSSDGTKMFILNWAGATIHQYSLDTGWSVSSATYASTFSYDGLLFDQKLQQGMFFRPDGLKVYTSNQSLGRIFEFDLG